MVNTYDQMYVQTIFAVKDIFFKNLCRNVSNLRLSLADHLIEQRIEIRCYNTWSSLWFFGQYSMVKKWIKNHSEIFIEHQVMLLAKTFQPFLSTKPTGKGTGLGLSLSYDIVKAHGGELCVESKEGEGTEFMILLPKT